MPRSRARFTQADVMRAVKGAKTARLAIGRVEIDADGKIVLIAATDVPDRSRSALDEWQAKRKVRDFKL